MNEPVINYAKEFLLPHEILSALRQAGISIDSHGTDEKGYTALNEFQLNTAQLHFGTLADIVNCPDPL